MTNATEIQDIRSNIWPQGVASGFLPFLIEEGGSVSSMPAGYLCITTLFPYQAALACEVQSAHSSAVGVSIEVGA